MVGTELGYCIGILGQHALLADFPLAITRGSVDFIFEDKPLGSPLKRAGPKLGVPFHTQAS